MANVIRDLVIKVTVDADTSGFDEMDDAQEKSGTASIALGNILADLSGRLLDAGIAAAKAGAAMLNDLVFGTAAAGDELVKTADKLQVPVEQLQRLQGAAELAGASSGDLSTGLKDLQKNIGEGFEKGTGPGVEALGVLGLTVEEVKTSLDEGDIEGALGLIGDAANDLDDPVRSNAALLKLMGGAGAELGVLLGQGTDGIKAAGDAIAETGVVMDREGLAKFEAMQDASLLLEKQIQGFKNEIALGLAPAVTDIATRVGDWISENDEFISQDLPGILERVVDTAIQAAEFTLETATAFREFARDAGDLIEILHEGDSLVTDVSEGMDTLGNAASGAALGVLDLTESFLESIGAAEELIAIVRAAKAELLGDSSGDTTGKTRSAAFLGGGESLVNPADAKAAESSGDTTKLKQIAADPKFSDSDRAKASADAVRIDEREAGKAEEKAAAAASDRANKVEATRKKGRAAQRSNKRAGARAKVGSGGGGGGKDELTVDELIAATTGAPSAGPGVIGGSALSGTILNTIDNSVNITAPVTIEVSASLDGTETGADLGERIAEEVQRAQQGMLTRANDFAEARGAVGGG